MRMVLAAAFLLLILQPARAGAAGQSVAASASPVFEFHSGFWVNLHHFLYLQGRLERARAQGDAAEGKIGAPFDSPASVEGMTAEERRAWQAAVQTYADSWSSRDLLLSNQMVLINDRLAELEDCPDLAGKSAVECTSGIVPELVTALDEAAPIYRRRWWPEQDRMNRAWIAGLYPAAEHGRGDGHAACRYLPKPLAGADSCGCGGVRRRRGRLYVGCAAAPHDFKRR